MEITVATWNIAGGRPILTDGNFDYDTEDVGYFVEQLQKLNADVVCLQETHLNEERSVAKEIAIKLGYDISEVDMSPSHIDRAYSLGNAVLFKKEPKNIHDFVFPYPTFSLIRADGVPTVHTDKGFQVLEYEFGNIVNLQMQPLKFLGSPYDSMNGIQFAKEMEDFMLQKINFLSIFCGDFNYKDAKTLNPKLLANHSDALPDTPTRPGEKKTDYIFVPNSYQVIDSGIIETRTDHFLCWAKIET